MYITFHLKLFLINLITGMQVIFVFVSFPIFFNAAFRNFITVLRSHSAEKDYLVHLSIKLHGTANDFSTGKSF